MKNRAAKSGVAFNPDTYVEPYIYTHPTDFTLRNVVERIEEKGDLFSPVTTEKHSQSLDEILGFLQTARKGMNDAAHDEEHRLLIMLLASKILKMPTKVKKHHQINRCRI